MTQLADFGRPTSLRAVVRGLADRRLRSISTRETAASAGGPLGGQLARLGPAWRVVDGVAAGHRGHIDHVAIGPGGVFVISGVYDARRTVCLGVDSLLIDGTRVPHVRQSRRDIADVAERLSHAVGHPVPVKALVMIYGDRRFALPAQPDDTVVRIATPAAGVRWMRSRPVEWGAVMVKQLQAAADSPTTWLSLASPESAARPTTTR